MSGEVRLPASAVATDGDDISAPTARLLRDLSLLPTKVDLNKSSKPSTAFTGTPESVAVIEAGATAISKAWAAGLGVGAAALWGSVVAFWGENTDQRSTILWVAGIASAAVVLAIGHIVSSDVRGRAAATVATYEARSRVSVAMIEAARQIHNCSSTPLQAIDEVLTMPAPLTVKNTAVPGPDEAGWRALAIRSLNGDSEYFLSKDSRHVWVKAADVELPA